ncbi:hypothetical protein [Rugosimonospora africana]|uniref:Uncharacterized protein n=1 Tax=Rugosimonospora africana TaxID=556532 RepID=A0A8J3R0U5_9ACTN|nr:hypothetical protein [Rugosimonospora africana]GIH19562.1 hypothetical protein Raf01_77340 [Rugosimonospora africana]
MRYQISVVFDETDGLATPDEDTAIDVFNDRLVTLTPGRQPGPRQRPALPRSIVLAHGCRGRRSPA